MQNPLRRKILKAASLSMLTPFVSLAKEKEKVLRFPSNFLFGVSTSAYQIEGAWNEAGKGESIWDRFCHIPGNTKIAGDVACDHYHKVEEDIALLKKLNINVYRFSISWPRVLPNGVGEVNADGLNFYKKIVNLLAANKIQALVTLNHWDLPQKLQDKGGWANRETTEHFANYAKLIFSELGNQVSYWGTHNEAWVISFMGHFLGKFAPGLRDINTALLVSHHLHLAHGKAVREFRKLKLKGKIGISVAFEPTYPLSDSQVDKSAAERINACHDGWFIEPIMKGKYPELAWNWYKDKGVIMPTIESEDMAIIGQPIDYIGVNFYHINLVKHNDQGWWPYDVNSSSPEKDLYLGQRDDSGKLLELLKKLDSDFNKPEIIITENGLNNYSDSVASTGQVHDQDRIDYISQSLKACKSALDLGIKLNGYIVWTLMDSFEWGAWSRLGLVHTDFKTLKRTVKQSGYWYADGIRNGFKIN